MDQGDQVRQSDILPSDMDGRMLQSHETLAARAFQEQVELHAQHVARGNWNNLAAQLVSNVSTTETLLPQTTSSGATPASAVGNHNALNSQILSPSDQLDLLFPPVGAIETEAFLSSLNNLALLSPALQMSNAFGAIGPLETQRSASENDLINTARDISASRHPNNSSVTAQQVENSSITNDCVADRESVSPRMNYFDARSDATSNARLARGVHETSDANDSLRQDYAETNHHNGEFDRNLDVESQQQDKDSVAPGDEPFMSESDVVTREKDLYCDPETGTLYSRGSSSVPKNSNSDEQTITKEQMEAILGTRVFIGESDEDEEPAARQQCDMETAQKNLDGQERSGVSGAPEFVVVARNREGNFSYDTVKVHKPAICVHCEQIFPFQELLEAHIRSKHEEKPKKRAYRKRKRVQIHKCDKCQREFKNAANLKRHNVLMHGENVIAECEYCDAPFSSKHGYTLHMRDRHNVVPSSVEKRFGPNVYEERALKKQKSAVDNTNGWIVHSCSTCKHWTVGKGNMQRHIKITHIRLKDFPCKHCSMQFKTKSNMELHCVTKHPEKLSENGKSKVQGGETEEEAEDGVIECEEDVKEEDEVTMEE